MRAFLQAAVEATTAFSATNIDDLFLLMMFFTPSHPAPKPWQVICGQFVGIGVLVVVSLLSLLGRLALPEGLIGLLGLFPISLGLSQLGETFAVPRAPEEPRDRQDNSLVTGVMAGILGVASLTIANGSDNISVYMAMLANCDPFRLRVILGMFALLTWLWCSLAWWLSQTPALAQTLQRFRRDLAPLLLVGIGALVLHDSHTLQHPPQAMVTLICLAVMATSLIQQLHALLASRRLTGISPP
jgi:cadmium resistance protein CadD (predicted permease)